MKIPLISICLPTYNRANYIVNQVRNIINQTKDVQDEVEVLLGDNASTDQTQEKLVPLCFPYSNVVYYRQSRNIGAEGNFLFLAKKAKAKYFWCIGDDDAVRPCTIKYVVDILKRYNDLGAVILHTGGTICTLSNDFIIWKPIKFAIKSESFIQYTPDVLLKYPTINGDTDWMSISKAIIQREAYIRIASDNIFKGNMCLAMLALCYSIKERSFYYATQGGFIIGLYNGNGGWHSKAFDVCQNIIDGVKNLTQLGFSQNEIDNLMQAEEKHLYYVNTLGCIEMMMSIQECIQSNRNLQKRLGISPDTKRYFSKLSEIDPERVLFLSKALLDAAYNDKGWKGFLEMRRSSIAFNYIPSKKRELKWMIKYFIVYGTIKKIKRIFAH